MFEYDMIVVGAGAIGTGVAYHAARRGQRVLLLEQFAIGHTQGSSHGYSRIIRYSYSHQTYVKLARSAFQSWRDLEDESGQKLLTPSGGLDLGLPDNPDFMRCQQSLSSSNIPYELLSTQELSYRFPQFAIADDTIGMYQADAGILEAWRCVRVQADQAQKYGAIIHENEPVHHIECTVNGVDVVTFAGRYHAGHVVIANGAWVRHTLRELGLDIPFTVTKEQVLYFPSRQSELFQVGCFPIFIHYSHNGTFYGFPEFALPGVKIAQHHGGATIEPNDERTLDATNIQRVKQYVTATMPAIDPELLTAQACLYTNTLDEDFILDFHPAHPQVIIASCCSGHGFKFSNLIGSIITDLAIEGRTNHPIELFTLKRFLP